MWFNLLFANNKATRAVNFLQARAVWAREESEDAAMTGSIYGAERAADALCVSTGAVYDRCQTNN